MLDLNSENGTFVNNRRISEPTQLKDGDVLNLSAVKAKYIRDSRKDSLSSDSSDFSWSKEQSKATRVLMTMDADASFANVFGREDAVSLIENLSRGYRFLNDLGTVISQTSNADDLLKFVLDEIFELLPLAARAFILLRDRKSGELIPKGASAREGGQKGITASRTLVEDAVSKRKGILVENVRADSRYGKTASLHAIGLSSAMCVPMVFNNDIYGVIQVDTNVGRPFGKADLAFLLTIAQQVGASLAYSDLHAVLLEQELLERDLMLARRLQQQFLPRRPPRVAELEIAVEYSPALAVGGDFYDFLELADGRIGLAVADVSGKGVSAALYAAKLSSELRYHSAGRSDPAEILSRLNEVFARDSREGIFVTLVFIALTPRSGELTISSAGHPLPVARRAGRRIQTLGQGGDPPLGLDPAARFHTYRHSLDPSDIVTLYTDGITEAETESQELFGEKGLFDAIQNAEGTTSGVLNAVLSAVKTHTGGARQSDDITLLCFGRSR